MTKNWEEYNLHCTNLMHLGFWVNENVDKDVTIINHTACD